MSTIGPVAVAHELITQLMGETSCGTTEPAAERILRYTLNLLTAMDGWDDEAARDVLKKHEDLPWVIDAFRFHEIYLYCDTDADLETESGVTIMVTCSRPKGHIIDHWDEEENLEWPIAP